ncbi:lysophospholipase [Algoriphagus lutimaris]|uniref:alpha/beta hydrolase n=1 Tax=Algoriphagus lutimaris TaxID=613197 RepID=UPI00196AB3CD|nr:alpha/beta hydrolase [Algoriphagus lutimaris]MBN3518510.1 lysophospholipase [Algoriphagus lutimaris]
MNHFESTYEAPDGVKLYLQAWMPDQPKASLLLIHGLGEHSGRYTALAETLVSIGVSVFSFDGRGHGKSAPNEPDAYFESYLSYLEDIHVLFEKAKNYQASLPIFLYGHSMGGGFAAAYVLKYNPELNGVILSSPAIMEDPKTPKILKSISGLISKFLPRLKALKLDPKGISKLKKEVQRYLDDPLIYKDAYPARTAAEVFNMMKYIQEHVVEFDQSVLLLHGTSDTLTNPEGSKLLFEKSNSIDKTLKLIPGGYHELINDTDSELVLELIKNWLKDKL